MCCEYLLGRNSTELDSVCGLAMNGGGQYQGDDDEIVRDGAAHDKKQSTRTRAISQKPSNSIYRIIMEDSECEFIRNLTIHSGRLSFVCYTAMVGFFCLMPGIFCSFVSVFVFLFCLFVSLPPAKYSYSRCSSFLFCRTVFSHPSPFNFDGPSSLVVHFLPWLTVRDAFEKKQ